MERICIFGAGAIGTFIGARLASAAKTNVNAVARGKTLDSLKEHGWKLVQDGRTLSAPVNAVAEPSELGPQDLLIIAVKGQAMQDVAKSCTPLIGPDTVVLPALNGVPWWFAEGVPALAAKPLESVDPNGAIASAIPGRHILGCVVHAAAAVVTPGVVEHRMGNGLIVGEPAGTASSRLSAVVGLLSEAGFDVTPSGNIRQDIWYKLWGNLTMNPVSAITGATADRILDDTLVRDFCSAAMREAAEIGLRIGCPIDQSPDDRHEVTRKLGAFKTSMLQDVEAGRSLELDPIVGAVSEIGRRVGVDTPNINALLGLARLFARSHGLYPA